MWETMSDADLMRAFYCQYQGCKKSKECSDTSLGLIYSRYLQQLYGYLRGLHEPPERAEDIINEAFLRIMDTKYHRFGNAEPFDPDKSQFTTWLYTIVKHLCWDGRGRDLLTEGIFRTEGAEEQAPKVLEGQAVGGDPTPEPPGEAKERREEVHRCIQLLPPREQVVIILWMYMGGATSKQLAEVLGCSTAQAWRIEQSASLNLRKCLKWKERKGRLSAAREDNLKERKRWTAKLQQLEKLVRDWQCDFDWQVKGGKNKRLAREEVLRERLGRAIRGLKAMCQRADLAARKTFTKKQQPKRACAEKARNEPRTENKAKSAFPTKEELKRLPPSKFNATVEAARKELLIRLKMHVEGPQPQSVGQLSDAELAEGLIDLELLAVDLEKQVQRLRSREENLEGLQRSIAQLWYVQELVRSWPRGLEGPEESDPKNRRVRAIERLDAMIGRLKGPTNCVPELRPEILPQLRQERRRLRQEKRRQLRQQRLPVLLHILCDRKQELSRLLDVHLAKIGKGGPRELSRRDLQKLTSSTKSLVSKLSSDLRCLEKLYPFL